MEFGFISCICYFSQSPCGRKVWTNMVHFNSLAIFTWNIAFNEFFLSPERRINWISFRKKKRLVHLMCNFVRLSITLDWRLHTNAYTSSEKICFKYIIGCIEGFHLDHCIWSSLSGKNFNFEMINRIWNLYRGCPESKTIRYLISVWCIYQIIHAQVKFKRINLVSFIGNWLVDWKIVFQNKQI